MMSTDIPYPTDRAAEGEEFRVVVERDPSKPMDRSMFSIGRPWQWAVFVWDGEGLYFGDGRARWRLLDQGLWDRACGYARTPEKAEAAARRAIAYHFQILAGEQSRATDRLASRKEIKLGVHELTTGD